MRARQRHFNARDAGATLVLDARFVHGKSNNDELETWPGRAGADATQTTATKKPIYQSAKINGQPTVYFDRTDFLSYSSVSSRFAMIVARRLSGSYYAHGVSLQTAGINQGLHSDSLRDYFWNWSPTATNLNGSNNPANNFKWFENPAILSIETPAFSLGLIGFGDGGSFGPDMDVMAVVACPVVLSSPLIRRISIASALSFKIAYK